MKALRSNALRRTTSGGFIVVTVLWLLSALSALVSIYAVYVINTAAGVSVHDDRLRSEALVSAAVELAAHQQLVAAARSRPTHGRFNFRSGNASIDVEFLSETARIDLNAAPKQLLAGLFMTLGADFEEAENYSDRIIRWRTAAPRGLDPEGLSYRSARLSYGPRRAKFPHTLELALVRDLPSTIVQRTLPFVTVYSGRPQVNILVAAPEVISALPGMSRDRLNAVLTQRLSSPEKVQAFLPLLGPAQQYATFDASNTIRINVRITFDNGRKAASEVIIVLFEEGDEPFAVLSWHDDVDDPPANDGSRREL